MGTIEGKDITVHFSGRRCIHARRCVLGLPEAFKPGTKGGWIFPENADTEALARVIDACPSGALTYDRKDGGTQEPVPPVNTARLWENGPLELRGDLRLPGGEKATRALLCRCGKSANKPFCDNSHIDAGFTATGQLPPEEGEDKREAPGGPLEIVPVENGPAMAVGNLELICGSGARIGTRRKVALCRCGGSGNKPYCDGTHNKLGFEAEG